MREAQLTCARHAALQDFFAIGVTSIRNVVQPRESERHARVVSPCLPTRTASSIAAAAKIQMPKAEVECREVEDGVLDDAARVASGC